MQEILNSVGTIMNIVGLVLIFQYGISPMTPREGKIHLYKKEELDKKLSPMHQKEKMFFKRAKAGLYISIIGMFVQLFSSLFQY